MVDRLRSITGQPIRTRRILRAQSGLSWEPPKAITATAYKPARIIYHMLKTCEPMMLHIAVFYWIRFPGLSPFNTTYNINEQTSFTDVKAMARRVEFAKPTASP